MNKRAKEIVAEAWQITNNSKGLIRYGVIPAFLGIIFWMGYILYQYFTLRELYTDFELDYTSFFPIIKDFAASYTTLSISLLVFVIVYFIAQMFVPIICSGALVHLISRIYNEKEAKHGLSKAFTTFLPLFEMSAIKSTMEPKTFFTEWSMVARNLGPAMTRIISPFLLFYFIFGIFFLYFCIFTTQAIVLLEKGFAGSIGKSAKLVMQNFGTTFSLFLLFLLIELRVLINVAVILFLPLSILLVTNLLATLIAKTIGITLMIIISVLLIILTAFLTGTLSVFSHAIWTIAFIKFQEEET